LFRRGSGAVVDAVAGVVIALVGDVIGGAGEGIDRMDMGRMAAGTRRPTGKFS